MLTFIQYLNEIRLDPPTHEKKGTFGGYTDRHVHQMYDGDYHIGHVAVYTKPGSTHADSHIMTEYPTHVKTGEWNKEKMKGMKNTMAGPKHNIGVSGVKHILRHLKTHHPEIKTFGASRGTGAKAHRPNPDDRQQNFKV